MQEFLILFLSKYSSGIIRKWETQFGIDSSYLPAAERRVQGTLREWGVLACSWQRRKPPPGRQSPGRGPRRSAAPTAAPRNCEERHRGKEKAECY